MKHLLLFCLVFVLVTPAFAQRSASTPDSLTLQGQYQGMLRKSRQQDIYKLVNPYRLSQLWKNAMDSLSAERRKVKTLEARNKSQNSRLDSQAASLGAQQKSLEASQNRVDEISFLGIPIQKSTYNLLMWGLVVALAAAFTFVFLRSAGYRREARQRTEQANDIAQEFQAYKSRASEKEKKLARELQDERNKLDELSKK